MSRSRSTNRVRRAAALTTTVSLLVACSSVDPDDGTGTSGGRAGTGGSAAAGGASAGKGGGGGKSAGAGGTAGAAGTGGGAGKGGTGGTSAAGSAGTLGTGGVGGAGQAGTSGGAGAASGGASGSAGSGGRAGGTGGGSGGMSGNGGRAGSGGGDAPPIGKKFVGNIDSRGRIRPDFATYWNQFSAENAGKWDSVERTRDQMNWSSLDTMYQYAKDHGVIFKHHTFVWGKQQPGWVANIPQAEQREEVEEWIRLFCERYPDTAIIDVVNEPPPHTTPSYVAALGGAGASGFDWIAQAFKWAHQYCPNAILLLNDYNNIEYPADNARTIEIANKIKSAGAPIHGIGAQAHDANRIATGTVKMYIDRIASETQLPVYITEYDLPIADDNRQREVMESQFTMFWDNENVKGITFWGYIVGQTWVSNSGLMTSEGQMRPAMTWLTDFLEL
jgi:endo-1,4-beta-xylanase